MSLVFADSFYFIALSNPSDAHHERAVRVTASLSARLLTTEYVLVEVADALCAASFRSEVARFLRDLAADPGTEIIAAGTALYERGLDFHARRPDKAWSLTDCISFVVMTDRRVVEALTGDHHFEQAGFHALLRPPT